MSFFDFKQSFFPVRFRYTLFCFQELFRVVRKCILRCEMCVSSFFSAYSLQHLIDMLFVDHTCVLRDVRNVRIKNNNRFDNDKNRCGQRQLAVRVPKSGSSYGGKGRLIRLTDRIRIGPGNTHASGTRSPGHRSRSEESPVKSVEKKGEKKA